MYEKHTQPILERRVAFVMRAIQTTLDGMLELLEVHPDLMVVSYATPRQVFYKERYCWSSPRQVPTDFERKGLASYIKGMNKYVRKPKEVKKTGEEGKDEENKEGDKAKSGDTEKKNSDSNTQNNSQTNNASTNSRSLRDWKWNRRAYRRRGRRYRRRWKSRRLTEQTPVKPDDPWTGKISQFLFFLFNHENNSLILFFCIQLPKKISSLLFL